MRRCCTTAENIYQSCGKQLFTGVTGVCSEAAQTPLTPAKSCCNRTNCPGQQILGREKSQQPSLSVFVFSKGEKLSFYKPALVGSDQLFPENTIINRRANCCRNGQVCHLGLTFLRSALVSSSTFLLLQPCHVFSSCS